MSKKRFIDQFEVILLDMGRTFMFEVDRFDEHDDLGTTYRQVGGKRLGDRQVYQILCEIFQQIIADSKKPENYENFPSVISCLQKHPGSSSLPADEIRILEEVFFQHEKGMVPDEYIRTLQQLHISHRLGIISDVWSRNELFYQELDQLGRSLKAAIPTVILGKNHTINHVTASPIIAIPFSTSSGGFCIEVCFEQ